MKESKMSKKEQKAEPEKTQEALLTEEIETLKEKIKESEDKYLRTLAETENSRKRTLKEKEKWMQYAVEDIACDFLAPIDGFENALKFAKTSSDEVKNWAIGFEMILNQLKQVLEAHQILPYESAGKTFDPHLHEAVEVVHTNEHPNDFILEELVKGYKMGDRIIRVARVKVAKPVKDQKDLNQEEGETHDKEK